MGNTIAFMTLGCKLNYAETSTYERGFADMGFEKVPWGQPADIYLVNTCTVTQHSESKCRNAIRRCHKQSPQAVIVVTGCYAELRPEELQALDGVSLVFGAGQKSEVVSSTVSLFRNRQGLGDFSGPEICETSEGEVFPAYSIGERTRAFLKVQDGCNNFCAYCTVPFARGNSRNIPVCELVRQAREIAAGGAREIVLTGVNTGDFGRTTGESFLDLLKALDAVEGIERYRISSIEPNLITEEIVDWIASGTKFQPHFHIPLQTGNDELLHAMGRKYTTEFFASRIDYIREKLGDKVFIGVDVIVGLPGETDEMFGKTYDFLDKRIHPAYLHIFPYSRRPGTKAAMMKNQVQENVKTRRVEQLGELCRSLHREFVESCRGMQAKVLFESTDKDGMMGGYTQNYIRVQRPYDDNYVGKVVDLVLEDESNSEWMELD